MKSFAFVPLTDDLVASAARLSSKVGWNQTKEDWRRLRRMHPGGVRVWVDDGEVRASYSVVGYGRKVAWIGMILADPDYRGRGIGKWAFAEALELARSEGHAQVGLDATEMGEVIYRKFGFECSRPIVRWQGRVGSRGAGERLERGLAQDALDFDRRCMGVDRSPLLHDLSESGEVFRLNRNGFTAGLAALRPGRTAWHVGPLVADSLADFEELFRRIAARCTGQQVVCDVLREEAGDLLSAHGLKPGRTLQRMTLPQANVCLNGTGAWFASGFEWG